MWADHVSKPGSLTYESGALTNRKPIFCTHSFTESPLGLYRATVVVSACIACDLKLLVSLDENS